MKIDDLDRKILEFLQNDGRMAASHIADELDISIPTVTDRIKNCPNQELYRDFMQLLTPNCLG